MKGHMQRYIRALVSKFGVNLILYPHIVTVLILLDCIHSAMGCVVALKEIRLNPEEGTPFTAIREGGCGVCIKVYL